MPFHVFGNLMSGLIPICVFILNHQFAASRTLGRFVCCRRAELTITSQQLEAYNYYKRNTMSIEILKDDYLQKVNFRVKNKVCSLGWFFYTLPNFFYSRHDVPIEAESFFDV